MYACLNSDSDEEVLQKIQKKPNTDTDSDIEFENSNTQLSTHKKKKNKKHKIVEPEPKKEPKKELKHESELTENSKSVVKKVQQKTTKIKPTDKNKNFVTLFADNVEITVSGKKLINESNIVINSETKYFLMGNNGCGKTTLMKYLYEKLSDKDILMIDQDVQIESTEQTIKEFILCADVELYQKHKQLVELEKFEELTDELQELYTTLSEYVYSKNWDRYEAKSNQILNGLGFNDPNKKIALLSGGWRMRLALGRALLYEPNILFLDESNNHCDLWACIWLIDYLKTYSKTIVMITHQIGFINELAEYIWYIGDPECTGAKLYTIKGKYHNLLQFQEQTKKEMTQKYEKLQKKLTEMRKKTVTKAEIDDVIKKANAPKPPKEYSVSIKFEEVSSQFGLKNIIELKNVSFGYDNSRNVLNNVELGINLKSRYVVVGDNGAGKTTFFKLCMGQVLHTSGEIVKDDRIRVAHYHQLTVDNLPLEMTAIEYMQSLNTELSEDQCRARLGRIGLKKIDNLDIPKNLIKHLSGGQKCRLAFAVIQLWSPGIILLDEPTNNLDITSIEALIEAINEFNGAIVLITHDTHLIESIINYELLEVKNGKLRRFNGDFDEYKDSVLQ